MKHSVLWICILLAKPSWAGGESAADFLIQAAPGSRALDVTPDQVGQSAAAAPDQRYDLSDPFMAQLFAAWQSQSGLPGELNAWMNSVLMGKSEEAAHQWTRIRWMINEKGLSHFEPIARAAWLSLLWKLNLRAAFLSEWMGSLSRQDFLKHPMAFHLSRMVAPQMRALLEENGARLSEDDQRSIEAAFRSKAETRDPQVSALYAWGRLRKGLDAMEALEALPPGHFIKIPLAGTVALGAASKNDLALAGRILKKHLEPALENQTDAAKLGAHYLQVARLLYQVGAFEQAQSYYEKIPRGAPSYLKAREEITWVFLRRGDLTRLRGELASLSSPVYDEKFFPEVDLVRAVSNLKLCFYEQVEKDLIQAKSRLGLWAPRIEAAIAATAAPRPSLPDEYSMAVERWIAVLSSEREKLATLSDRNVSATLPAVGVQPHWSALSKDLALRFEDAKKIQEWEYRRQWMNDRKILSEAIQKLRFVKVEYLSQVDPAGTSNQRDALKTAQAQAQAQTSRATLGAANNDLIFPKDEVYWPDELFKLRAMAETKCLATRKGK